MIRRGTDKIQIVVTIGSLLGLFTILYTIYRDSYGILVRSVESFELRVKEVVERQNVEIEKLRDNCCGRRR